MKKLQVFAFSFLILLFQTSLLFAENEKPSSEIIAAAKQGINTFVKDPNMTNLQDYGFATKKDIDSAVLGKGYHVYTVNPDTLLNNDTQDLGSMAVPTDMWEFLIMSQGKAVSVLTIAKMNDRWTAVSIGKTGMAEQMGNFIKKWPESKETSHRLIRIYQAASDLMELSQTGKKKGFVPFMSSRAAMGLTKTEFDPSDVHDSKDITTQLGPAVRRNIEGRH